MNELIAETHAGVRRRAVFDPSRPLGNPGATGIVYKDLAKPGHVLKIYKTFVALPGLSQGRANSAETAEARDKINAMLATPPGQQTAFENGTEFTQIAWPQEKLLTSDGRFIGLSMREINFDQSAAIEDLFLESRRNQMKLAQNYEFRLIVAQNLATLANLIHDRGHAIVDLQPQNVRVYRRTGWVGLLDCDGYHIAGAKSFPARVLRPDFAAPELQRANGNVRPDMGDQLQDRFGVALIIFMMLNDGLSPFNVRARTSSKSIPSDIPGRIRDQLYGYGRHPHADVAPATSSIHDEWPRPLREMFDRAFGVDAQARPTPLEWSTLIDGLLANARDCKTKQHHGKSVLSGKCMLCVRETMLGRATSHAQQSVRQTSYGGSNPSSVHVATISPSAYTSTSASTSTAPQWTPPTKRPNIGGVVISVLVVGFIVLFIAAQMASRPPPPSVAADAAPPAPSSAWVETASVQSLRQEVSLNTVNASAAAAELQRRAYAALGSAHGDISALAGALVDWPTESAAMNTVDELRQLLSTAASPQELSVWSTSDAPVREWPAARAPVLFNAEPMTTYQTSAQVTNEGETWYAFSDEDGGMLYARASDFTIVAPEASDPLDLRSTVSPNQPAPTSPPGPAATPTYINLSRVWVSEASARQIADAYPEGRRRRTAVSVRLDCLIQKGGSLYCTVPRPNREDAEFERAALGLAGHYRAPEYFNGSSTDQARTRMLFRFDP